MHLDELVHSLRERIKHSNGDNDLRRRPGERSSDYWLRVSDAVRTNQFAVRTVLGAYCDLSALIGPCDREKAERAVCAVYDAMLLRRPQFLWFDSPVDAAISAGFISLFSKATASLAQSMLRDAKADGYDDLLRAIYEQHNRTEKSFTDHNSRIARELFRSLWDVTMSSLSDRSIERFVPFQYRGAMNDWFRSFSDSDRINQLRSAFSSVLSVDRNFNRVNSCRIGSGDAWDLSVFHASTLFGLSVGDTFHSLRETMLECGWWWPIDNFCVMSDRPVELVFDGLQLHKRDGAAVRYACGFELFFWKDLAVTQDVVYGRFTAKDIDAESNLEVRRAMIDRFGLERYLASSGAELIHEDECGMLYRKDMGEDEPLLVVRVRNSTPEPDGTHKDYFLRVPPIIERAREAVAWTFGLHELDYCPSKET